MTIVITMIKLLSAMLLGLYFGKKKVISVKTNKEISSMLVNYVSPILVISSVTTVQQGEGQTVLTLLVMGIVIYAALPFVGLFIAKLLKVDKDLIGTYTLCILLCNSAFMGYPVSQALFGDEAIFYTSILHFPFNLFFYSLGIYLINKDADVDSGETFHPKKLINNGTIAAIAAVVIYFTHIQIPEMIAAPFSFIGNMTMPLSMVLIGHNIAEYSLEDIFKDKKVYIMTLLRLVVIPFIIYGIANLVTDDIMIIRVATVTFGMPVAALVAMGTAPYEKQGKVGSINVAFSTICSFISIPIMAFLLGM